MTIITDGISMKVDLLSPSETAPDYDVVYQIILRRTPVGEADVLKEVKVNRKSRVKD
jgi:hypothetical protein